MIFNLKKISKIDVKRGQTAMYFLSRKKILFSILLNDMEKNYKVTKPRFSGWRQPFKRSSSIKEKKNAFRETEVKGVNEDFFLFQRLYFKFISEKTSFFMVRTLLRCFIFKYQMSSFQIKLRYKRQRTWIFLGFSNTVCLL